MILDEALAKMEKMFRCHEWVPRGTEDLNGIAPNGESYIVLSSGGFRKEVSADGNIQPLPAVFSSENLAVDAWFDQVTLWSRRLWEKQASRQESSEANPIAMPPYDLYWRIKPEIDWIEYDWDDPVTGVRAAHKWYFIYSRLLVTDVPAHAEAA